MTYIGQQNWAMVNGKTQLPHNYIYPGNPPSDLKAPLLHMTWLNSVTNEIFVAAGNTDDNILWVGQMGSIVSNNYWVPSYLADLGAWFDASDADSITLNGSTVSQWDDLSGNGRNIAQETVASQPTYNSASNSITFDGSNDYLYNTTPFMFAAGACSIFAVFKSATKGDDLRWICEGSSVDNGPLYCPLQTQLADETGVDTSMAAFFLRNDAATVESDQLTNYSATGFWKTSPSIYEFVDTGWTFRFGKNGVMETAGNYTRSGTHTFNTFAIGGILRAIFQAAMGFEACEIVLVESALSDTDREKMEGFLAHKWGLASSLPSEHPYRANAPLGG